MPRSFRIGRKSVGAQYGSPGLSWVEPVPVEADRVPDGHGVGVEQREMVERRDECLVRAKRYASEAERQLLVFQDEGPAERPVQGKGAALVVGAAIGAPDRDRHGLELRRPGRGEGELGEAEVAAAEGADRSVRPRLADNPVSGGPAVGRLRVEVDAPARAERAPGRLDDRVVTAFGEEQADGAVGAAAPVRTAHEDDRQRQAGPGQVDIGQQAGAVGSADHDIALHVNLAGQRGPDLRQRRVQPAGHRHAPHHPFRRLPHR